MLMMYQKSILKKSKLIMLTKNCMNKTYVRHINIRQIIQDTVNRESTVAWCREETPEFKTIPFNPPKRNWGKVAENAFAYQLKKLLP